MLFNYLFLAIICTMANEGNLSSDMNNLTLIDCDALMLFDFTKMESLNGWVEQSDPVREVGKSKAVLALQKTRVFQRAVFFTMLNPQPNGACFAGYRILTKLNLSAFNAFELWMRGQGQNYDYKVILRHKGLNDEPNPTYEQMFKVPENEFGLIRLEFSAFEPYYRGAKLNVSEVGALDTSNITTFGFQIYGGVYLPKKQAGTSSLEIDWVKAVK